mgnify:CR=1 FL=1
MAGIILQQAIIMLILNVVGMIAYYTGIVSREGGKQLSNVVLEIVTPVIIVHAYLEEEYDSRLVVNLLLTFVLAAARHFDFHVVFPRKICRKVSTDRAIFCNI